MRSTPTTLLDEDTLLLRVARRAARALPRGVVLGIGDDCAIFSPRAGEDLVFTTDLAVENIHFLRATHTPRDVGHKILARGLSDIAAMGAEPRFCLLSLALPKATPRPWIDGIFAGLLDLAQSAKVRLAGGDLGTAPVITADITVCGSVPRGRALRRDGAQVGDILYVSGRLGGSALGLAGAGGEARRRHLRPSPRLALGRYLRRLGASACIDLSDGLSSDLARLCRASRVAAHITRPPAFRGASAEQALHGGEDYELLFSVPPGLRVPPAFGKLPLTAIGTIRKGRPGQVLLDGQPLPARGYDHLRSHDHS